MLVVGCVLVLVVGSAVAPGVAGRVDSDTPDRPEEADVATAEIDAGESAAAATQTATDSDVRLTQRLGLVPDQPGVYEASHRYRLPDHLRVLEVTLPEGATVVSATGFRHREGRTYEWDGSTTTPRLDYRLPANRSTDQSGPIGGPGRLTSVDVGEWALVSQPRTGHSWGWSQGGPAIGFEQSMEAKQGVAGEAIAYLGDYEEYTTTAHGQEFRLIVPERARLAAPPEEVLASMANASDRLRVGDRDEAVFAVAAPTPESLDWGVRGLQTGDADMWVRDVEPLDEANNVWLHEYVHTRQAFATAPGARWFTEASAVYYAALLTLEDGRIPYAAVRDRLAIGEGDFGGSVMASPGTWQRNANYYVGALVAGELDRQLRVATDGRASLQEVLRRMNAKDGTVTAADFGRLLREAGGGDVERLGERYITTTERPTAWDADQHREAFGTGPEPARITYTRSEAGDGVRVDGPYRTRSLGSGEAVTLVPGERLTLDVVATNFGGVDGAYEALFRVDDEPRATRSGDLAPNESATLTFEHAFEAPGQYVVSVGDASLRVAVREPATPRVTGLAVDRREVTTGDAVTVAVDVRNDADRPGRLDLPITQDGGVVDTRTVRLDSGEETTVTADLRFDEPGTHVVGAGNASAETATVTVTGSATTTGTSGAGTPGFGPVAAVAALAVWIGLRRLW